MKATFFFFFFIKIFIDSGGLGPILREKGIYIAQTLHH